MKETILNQKVGLPEITGMTTINHAARIFLELNCSEYVLMNYIYQCHKNRTPMEVTETYRKTGFKQDEQIAVAWTLQRKGFLIVSSDPIPTITSKWESAFTDLEKEFEEEFWKKDGKSIWLTSSKKASFKFYSDLRKSYPKKIVIEARDKYVEYLEWEHKGGFNRAIMGCEKFLNPKNEFFLADWEGMTNKIKERLNPRKVQPASEEQITAAARKAEYDK